MGSNNITRNIINYIPRGNWVTSTYYWKYDIAYYKGSGYICLVPHTSGTWATDLANGYWTKFVNGIEFVGCRVYSSAEQSNLTDATYTKVDLDTEGFDIGANYDTTNKRFVAPVTGYYQVNAKVVFKDPVADKRVGCSIYVNGAGYNVVLQHTSSTSYAYAPNSCLCYVEAGQYIELYAVVYAGANTIDVYGHGAYQDSSSMDIFLVNT